MKPADEYLWNSTAIRTPEFEFFEAPRQISSRVKQALLKSVHANSSRDLLFLETATLSKYMIHRKDKYRSERGFNTIGKIKKAVNRFSNLKIHLATLFMKSGLSEGFVPSKQVCQWFLVKLQTASQLLHRIKECSFYSFDMLHRRLRTGHCWIELVVAMAMISRIRRLTEIIIQKYTESYEKLVAVVDELPFNLNDSELLPTSYKFPDDLNSWVTETKNNLVLPEIAASISADDAKGRINITKAIKKITSCQDLKTFFLREQKRRDKNRQKCVSKNLDALQWHMLTKRIKIWMKRSRKSEEPQILFRKIRKRLRRWFL